jgi:hypothetical protein
MDILHIMQWDGICHVLLNYRYLFPIYHMDVRNTVCHDITNLYNYVQQPNKLLENNDGQQWTLHAK